MLICDTHADTLFYLAKGNDPAKADVTYELLMRAGDTRVQALALFVGAEGLRGKDEGLVEQELRQLEALLARGFRQIRDISEAVPDAPNVMLTIEGGEAFGDSADTVDRFAALGVRAAAIVWNNENALAHPAVHGSHEGLKPFGREVIGRMRNARMALDISHLNDAGAREALDGGVPVMASHSCARALCPHPRNLSDELLRALFASGGYVGVNFYPVFLDESGEADIDRVIDHAAHMLYLGGEGCVGIGSDFDGIEKHPRGLRRADDVYALFERMRERGFDEKTIEDVAGRSFKRYMRRIGA